MDDIMRDLVSIGDAEEDGDVNDTEDLVAALNRIKEDANFSIPFSQKADHKQQGMSKFEFLQRISIKSFLNYRVKYGYGKMDASIATAAALFSKSPLKDSYRAQAIREWVAYYLLHGQLRPFRRGKFVKTYTIIVNEAVQNFLRDKIRGLKPLERSPTNVMNKLNSEWLKEIPQSPTEISESTARRWMYFLGFRQKVKGKNYFVDGHEREDVVQHRGEFLGSMEDLCQRCHVFSGDSMDLVTQPILMNGQKRVVIIVQDESIFYTNDSILLAWLVVNETYIKPKSTGQSQHVSAFTCDCHGFMKALINGQWKTSYKIITPGKNSDGYWTNDDLVKQIEDIDELVKYLHPDCDIVYLFDNSQNHHARRPDALWADNLNLSDGGKNTKSLRDTTWNGAIQHMQTQDGKQKGIKTILMERNLWVEGLKLDCKLCKEKSPPPDNVQCCARRILSQCDDFKVDKCWLEETVESLGHRLLFFPKFHCELNFIEMIWGYVKAKLRRMCTFSFSDLKKRLPELLDRIPLPFVKRASRHCLRYMDGYRKGLIGPELDYAIRKYRGHRMIPPENLELIKEEFKKQEEQKMRNSFKAN